MNLRVLPFVTILILQIAPKLVFNVKPDEIPRMMTCLYPGVCSEVLLALHASMK